MQKPDGNIPITVVMPVHNGEKYLDEAIRSIRDQTLNAFELIVVDDASVDRSFEIASAHAASDPRVRVLRFDQNVGHYVARNRGIAEGAGRFIAAMDGDDVALPIRLSSQLAFMDRNPDYLMISGGVDMMDSSGRVFRRQVRARGSYEVSWFSRFEYPMVHPSVMFRRQGPSGQLLRYNEQERTAQDYRLLTEVQEMGKTATLTDVVLRYRVHKEQISVKSRPGQSRTVYGIATALQQRDLSPEVYAALEPFRAAFYDGEFRGDDHVRSMASGLRQLAAFDAARRPDRRAWIKREAAYLMGQALYRVTRIPTAKRDLWMSRLAPAMALPLLLRRLESAGMLPGFLCVDPVLPR